MQINEQYLKISEAVYGIQPNADYSDVIDRTIWQQLSVNVMFGDGSVLNTAKDANGNDYYSTNSGMQAAAYKNVNTGEIVIAYRGTELNADDLWQDIMIATGLAPSDQFADADKFYQAVQTQYGSNITITGHSLGGGLAQMIGSKYGNTTYTYNAPGLNAYAGLNTNQITNFVVMNDWCGMLRSHAGTTYYIQPISIANDPLLDTHWSILNYNETDYGPIISKPLGFGTKEGLALWYYDINNDNVGVKQLIGTQVNETDLRNAVNIMNTQIGTPLHQLHYRTSTGDYIIGTDQSENGELGSLPLTGTDKNDTIYGNGGVDEINGLGGNDILVGGADIDLISGGAGNDTIYGDYEITSGINEGNDILFGDAGNDVIAGGGGDDIISGGADNDILIGGAGADILDGGAGNDTYIFDNNSDYNLDTVKEYKNQVGKDTLDFSGVTNNLNVDLSLANGGIFATGSDISGIEKLIGGAGSDTLTGSNYSGFYDKYTIHGNGGNDIITGLGSYNTIYGGDGSDRIYGGDRDTIYGDNDNTVISNSSFNKDDYIVGGLGNTIYGGEGNDTIYGGEGQCIIYGDSLMPNSMTDGNDVINGGSGLDTIYGGNGNDIINGNKLWDYIDGGDGDDIIYGDSAIINSTADINDYVTSASEHETLLGGNGNDTIYASNVYISYIGGGNGDDILYGGASWNGIGGDEGNDQIFGGDHGNTIGGGSGCDVLKGGAGSDRIYGDNRYFVSSEDGDDIIYAYAGADYLYGDGGNDEIDAGDDSDFIYGGTGNDKLIGGKGSDMLYGNEGNDTYVFNKGDGYDQIYEDFYQGDSNTIIFGEGFTSSNVIYNKYGNELVIGFNNSNYDCLKVYNQFEKDLLDNSKTRITNFQFSDGTKSAIRDTGNLETMAKSFGKTLAQILQYNPLAQIYNGVSFLIMPTSQQLKMPISFDEWKNNLGLNPTLLPTMFGLASKAFDFFTQSESVPCVLDPLVLDLDSDGIETTSLLNGKHFDFDNSSFAELMAWVGNDDGILVMDKNNNGIIDNGNELFGDQTNLTNGQLASNGFAALSELDTNADGMIDSSDSGYWKLWVLKGDGTRRYLSDMNIKSVSLASTAVNTTDANGNIQANSSSFTRWDDSVGTISEINFLRNTINSSPKEWLYESADIEALPECQGFGNVYTLHQAMVRDISGVLQNLVTSYVNETDPINRTALIDQILVKWAGVEGIDINDTTRGYSAQKLTILEKFTGHYYQNDSASIVNADALPMIESSYQNLVDYMNTELISQINFKYLFNKIEFIYNFDTNKIEADLSAVITELQNSINANPDEGKITLSQFACEIKKLNIVGSIYYDEFYNAFSSMGDDYKLILDYADNKIIFGTSNPDNINGSASSELIFAGDGNDIIFAGQGNDTLIGDAGDDVYVFNLGDGQDKIIDSSGTDTIRFGEGITLDNLSFEKQNLDLLVKIKDPVNGLSNDQIIVQYQYESSANYRIETFEFANGSSISCDDVESIITYGKIIKQGTDEADTIFGSTTNEDIYGNGGNDSLYAGGGTDNIYGGEGDDTLYGDDGDDFLYGENGSDDLEGGYGNDILTGGTGDDLLGGGSDNDTYIFNRGDGQDTIFDSDSEGFSWFDAGADDKIVFGEGITQNDLVITKSVSDYDVLITLKDADGNLTQDSILITNQLVAENKIEKLEFADGSSLTSADIESLFAVIEGSDSDDSLIGTGGDDVIDGGSGADIMAGGGGDDVYYVDNNGDIVTENSGEGTDEIISGVSYTLPENVENLTMNGVDNINANGNSGSNTILGNSGDNSINGHKDNDNLIGNGGDDKIDGGLGDDLLIGEVGNDDLNGGGGNDVYVFEKGDNIDTVKDTGGDDVIKFGSSVDKTNIAMFKDNAGNLYLDYGETGNADVIKVKNWNSASGQIEKIQLSDNSYITNTDVNLILQDMTAYAAANGISLTSVNAVKANAGLMNIIAMSWHS